VGLLGVLIAITALAIATKNYYFNVSSPDLQFSDETIASMKYSVAKQSIDQANGDFLFYNLLTPTLKNVGSKTGWVDKVEVTPLSMEGMVPKGEVAGIDRIPIAPGEEKRIEVRVLLRFPTNPTANLNQTVDIASKIVFNMFDNTGKKIDHRTNGEFGRMSFDFKSTLTFRAGVPQP
jgi:hypothetical protein